MSAWINMIRNFAKSFLLKEDGDYLLLETGDKIILDQSGWTNQTMNTSTWANQTKN